jgi:leucyl aminopeptidase (aminopeptidase T)
MPIGGNAIDTWVALGIVGVLTLYLVLRLIIWSNMARSQRKRGTEQAGGTGASAQAPAGQGPGAQREEMDISWGQIGRRIASGLGVQRGELIAVRDNVGRLDVLLKILLEIELRGATPLVQHVPPAYMERFLQQVPPDILTEWDRHRAEWARQQDRVLVLTSAERDFDDVPRARLRIWQEAVARLTELEDQPPRPYLLVAIPSAARAAQLGMSEGELEAILLPALAASREELQDEIDRVLALASGGGQIVLHSGKGHTLRLQQGDRTWLSDDGYIDRDDMERGANASNLPAGSIYSTVIEDQTEGSLRLPRAAGASDVVFTFRQGRIERIEAASGEAALRDLFDRHSGEPRRVSHIGVGLNPYLHEPIGWTLVDEHVHGCVFVAFGENRYMGGKNASSLNVDFAVPGATFTVGERVVVSEGKVAGST